MQWTNMINAAQTISTRPYLIRALFDWCNDNALTPYIAVKVDSTVQVPKEYVQNDEIVLNISLDATSGLQIGNDFIEFKARFGGTPRQIIVPVGQVIAIYAKENGQGMAFPAPNNTSTKNSNVKEGVSLTQVQNLKNESTFEESTEGVNQASLTLMTNESASTQNIKGKPSTLSSVKSVDENKGESLIENADPTEPSPSGPTGTRPKLTRIK